MGKERGLFNSGNMWEVDLPQKVGPQEKKGVFLSFMPGSSSESGLAPGSTLIAGGLQSHLGACMGPSSSDTCKGHRSKNDKEDQANFSCGR